MSDAGSQGRAKLGRAGLNGIALLVGAAVADVWLTVLTLVAAGMDKQRDEFHGLGAVAMNFVYALPLCLLVLGFAVYFTRNRSVRAQMIAAAVWFGLLFLVGMLASVYVMSRESGNGAAMVVKVLATPEILLGTLASASVGVVGAFVAARVRGAMTAKAA